MASAYQIPNAELIRVYAAAYQGLTARACLAENPGTLTKDSTTAQWDAVEITSQAAHGYARVVWTQPVTTYDNAPGQARTATQDLTFQASEAGLGMSDNTLYIVLGTTSGGVTTWFTNPSAVYSFAAPGVALAPGQPKVYRDYSIIDDISTIP
jgi:hypothetical protein